MSLFGSFRATRFSTRFDQAGLFERTSNRPEIGLAYDRSRLNARVLFADRAVRTTDESQNLDIRTFLASLVSQGAADSLSSTDMRRIFERIVQNGARR